MHIYFVNQYSKIVGPFDITDSNHQKNIRNGDVIIRDTSDGLCFLIVTSSINKWNRCKCIDTVQGHLKREGNFLLFSFDAFGKNPLLVMKPLLLYRYLLFQHPFQPAFPQTETKPPPCVCNFCHPLHMGRNSTYLLRLPHPT